jgi:hypothetical protein
MVRNHCDPRSEALTMNFVTVLEVLDPRTHPHEDGILCRVIQQFTVAELSLTQLEVPPECRNHTLLDDYWCWIWNCRGGSRSGKGKADSSH